MGALLARHISRYAPCANCICDREDRQKREGAVESRANAVHASTATGGDFRFEQAVGRRRGGQSAADSSEPATENLLCHASGRRATDLGVVLLQPRGDFANVSPLSAGSVPRPAAVYRSADQAL